MVLQTIVGSSPHSPNSVQRSHECMHREHRSDHGASVGFVPWGKSPNVEAPADLDLYGPPSLKRNCSEVFINHQVGDCYDWNDDQHADAERLE